MKIKDTNFKGLKILNGKIFFDSRGFFREMYQKRILKMHKPIFWCMSKSKKNVFRGLHLQTKNAQEKLVSVVKGKVLDIVVDLRPKSKTFGKHFKILLSDKNAKSILIPVGFAHGFLGLEKENIVLYSNNNYRSKKNEIGLLWNDKDLKISLVKSKLIISKKDKLNMTFSDYLKSLKINGNK
jgi:dTDP-4-dehydrorhamnose 3,5-epimerase